MEVSAERTSIEQYFLLEWSCPDSKAAKMGADKGKGPQHSPYIVFLIMGIWCAILEVQSRSPAPPDKIYKIKLVRLARGFRLVLVSFTHGGG